MADDDQIAPAPETAPESAPADSPETVEGDQEPAQAPAEIEVEYEGAKYRVPPELKDALLRQSDYTRKTQTVAEQRATLEAEQAGHKKTVEAWKANTLDQARLIAIDQQLAALQEVNWDQVQANDPMEAQKLLWQRTQLDGLRRQIGDKIAEYDRNQALESERTRAKRIEEGMMALRRDIPNWTPELAVKVLTAGEQDFGLTNQEVRSIEDARFIRILHYARLGKQWEAQQRKAAAKPDAEPVPTITGKSVPRPKLSDGQNVDAWMRDRQRQVEVRR